MRTTARRLAAGLAVGLATALALTACSSSSSSTGSTQSDSLEVFSYLTSGSEADALNAVFDEYRKQYPDVTVQNGAVSGGGGANAAQVLQSRVSGDDAPAVWQAHPGANLETYAKGGLLEDLTPMFDQEKWTDKYPAEYLDGLKYDGKIYGVPFGINQMNLVWWNLPVAKKVGVTVGDKLSWDQMVAAADKAKAAGVTPFCLGDKDPFTTGEIMESAIISHIGANGWKKLTAGEMKWTDPGVAAGLKDYQFIYTNANKDHSALTWDQSAKSFATGGCLFLPLVDSAYGEFLKNGAKEGKDFAFVYYPGTEDVILNVSDIWVVSVKKPDGDNADDFVKVAGSPEGQLAYQKIKGQIPPRLDADVSSLGQYQKDFAAHYKTAAILQSLTFGQSNDPSVQQAFYDAITAFNTSGDVAGFTSAMDGAMNG